MIVSAVKALVTGKAHFRVPSTAHVLHKSEFGFHLAYFGGVFAEGHGLYRYAALALLVISVLSLFVHEAPSAASEVA